MIIGLLLQLIGVIGFIAYRNQIQPWWTIAFFVIGWLMILFDYFIMGKKYKDIKHDLEDIRDAPGNVMNNNRSVMNRNNYPNRV